MDYPYNVIRKIVDTSPSDDVLKAYEFAFSNLNERRQDCIVKYYKEGLSYPQIAHIYGLSSQRIMQIVATSISNLTAYSDYMKYGYDAYTKMDKERTAYLIDNVGFTPRVRNLLRRNGYSDIRQIKIEQLKVRKGIGATTIAEIEDKLQERKIDAK